MFIKKTYITVIALTLPIICMIQLTSGCYERSDAKATARTIEEHIADFNQADSIYSYIDVYKKQGDTVKLKSLYFLIREMSASDKKKINISFMIKNLESAVAVSRKQLTKGSMNFRDFCEYVLPYKIDQEEFSDWRLQGQKRYGQNNATPPDLTQPSEVLLLAGKINDDLKQGFIYNSRTVSARFVPWYKLLRIKEGDCLTMATLATAPLRAMGLPISIDEVPLWGNVNGGSHAWNNINLAENRYPFLGCESNPPYSPFHIYAGFRIPAKVFRNNFSVNKASLPHIKNSHEAIPLYLDNEHFIDVTDQYEQDFSTAIVSVKPLDALKRTAYLCVFSDGEWKPVFWGRFKNNILQFTKMATGMVYLPGYYLENKKIVPINYPVAVYSNKEQNILKPDLQAKHTIVLTTTQSLESAELQVYNMGLVGRAMEDEMDAVRENELHRRPINGTSYKLRYWNEKWIDLDIQKANHQQIVFNNVPANCLYQLVEGAGNKKERVFTYRNHKQEWW